MSDALVWRGFTQAELDRAYSPSSKVESIEPYLARYAADSAAVREKFSPNLWQTVSYGPSPEHTIDVFRPAENNAPLIVFIHGGYWQALHARDASFPAQVLANVGLAYAAINYTLAPHATMDEIVEECRQAVAFLANNMTQLGVAPRGIVIAGHSAGAQLAAMMLTTDWVSRGIPATFIRGALLLGGVYDLEPIRLSYVNDALGMDAETARRNSPLFSAPPPDCPILIAWAEHDTDEFKRQSQDLALRWHSAISFEQKGVNHFDSLFDWYSPQALLSQATFSLSAHIPLSPKPS